MSQILVTQRASWLNILPAHWKVVEPRRIFALRREVEHPGDEHLTPSQKYGVLPQKKYMEITGNRVVQNLSGTKMQHVEPGDFISHLRTFQGGLELSRIPGKVSPAYTVVTPRGSVNPEYYKYALKSQGYISQISSVTDQLRDGQSMRYGEFNLTPLPAPPAVEQEAIADYLDHETAEIDATIREQERLADLIRERQSASIDFEYKAASREASRMLPVKHLFTINPSISHSKKQIPEKSTYLPMSAIGEFGSIDTSWLRPSDEMAYGYTYVENGDVLLAKVTPCFENGKGAVVSTLPGGVGFATTEVTCFRPIASMTSRYLSVILRTSRFRLGGEAEMTGAGGLKRVPDRYMMNFRMAHLEVLDQQNLVDRVDKIDRNSQELIGDLNLAIALARERRAALITAAVTGQIDVTARHKPAAEQLEDDIAQGLHREN
ncbi:hypothetical protein [Kocuria rhizophila]|uniref:restriction endonuclease subunit S n=1 Tax=Kocuria rhizophila TaxID=72000 RepID=UPI003D6E07B3